MLALGVLSPIIFRERRELCRATWLSDVPPGVSVRFAIAHPHNLQGDLWAALTAEQSEFGDLALLRTNLTVSTRVLSPLDSLLRWLRHAAAHFPTALFIAKCDDDVYIALPELLAGLRVVRSQPWVYFGRFYWVRANNVLGKQVMLTVLCSCSTITLSRADDLGLATPRARRLPLLARFSYGPCQGVPRRRPVQRSLPVHDWLAAAPLA